MIWRASFADGNANRIKIKWNLEEKIPTDKAGCNVKWWYTLATCSCSNFKNKNNQRKKIIKEVFASHRSLKMVTVVDDDIEPSSAEQVEYAMATRFQADKDLVLIKNVRGSSLDPSSDQKNLKTAKLGIDATRPLNKRKEGFEIAEIPKINKISLNDYL